MILTEFIFSKKTFDELNVDRVSVNTTGLRLPARVASLSIPSGYESSGPPRRCREEELGHSREAYGILRLFERASTLVENPFDIFDTLVGVRDWVWENQWLRQYCFDLSELHNDI